MGSQIDELNNQLVNLESLKRFTTFIPVYLEDIDSLIFQPANPVPAVSVDCDGDALLRVDPKTNDIVGIEIEDFEGYFIKKYPAFAPLWAEAKRDIKRNRCENEMLTAFLTIVQGLLTELVNKQNCIKLTPITAPGQSAFSLR